MRGCEQNRWAERRSEAGQWATGTLKALGTLAFSALVVWIAVSVISDSGLLERPAPARTHSPPSGTHFAQIAYG